MQKLNFAFIVILSCVAANSILAGPAEQASKTKTSTAPLLHDGTAQINATKEEPAKNIQPSQYVLQNNNVTISPAKNAEEKQKDQKTEPTPTTIIQTTPAIQPSSTTVKTSTTASNDDKTIPSKGTSSTSTTPKSDVSSSTAQPATTLPPITTTGHSKVIPAAATRGFDGASFAGGIILTMGLMAVGYLGFRYYKKTELNYRTL